MQDRLQEFQALDCTVVGVTQSRPDHLQRLAARSPRPIPLVADPDRVLYRAFGLERGRWSMLFRGRVIARYIGLMARGWAPRPAASGEDVLQLGGDMLIDRQKRLVWAFRSEDPSDRPSVETLLAEVKRTR